MDIQSIESPKESFRSLTEGYDPKNEMPLREYGVLISIYTTLFASSYFFAKRANKTPEEFSVKDTVLIGIAAHKVSRVIAKDKITGVIRAPFTEHGPSTGFSEVSDQPRGSGFQKTIGNLLTCPFCLGLWMATTFGFGLMFAPKLTRFIATVLTAETLSDTMQIAYGKIKSS